MTSVSSGSNLTLVNLSPVLEPNRARTICPCMGTSRIKLFLSLPEFLLPVARYHRHSEWFSDWVLRDFCGLGFVFFALCLCLFFFLSGLPPPGSWSQCMVFGLDFS